MTPNVTLARAVLAEARALGVDLADLIAAAEGRGPSIPTLAAWIELVDATFTPATAATYRSYWRLAVEHHGDRLLTDLGLADLATVVDAAAERARRNRPGSTGRASRETCVAALRGLFARAVAAGLLATNPAGALAKPRRARSRRRALDETELAELIDAVRATSSDPNLDLLLVRFHLETAARRSGAIAARRDDLDERRSTIWLAEKDTTREQPLSPSLARDLGRHHATRSLAGGGGLFLRSDGAPLTARHYDQLFARARERLAWAARTPVSAHVLRHTAITTVGRLGGYPVARAFAGHSPPTVTGRYLHATVAEVAAAVEAMTGERHPLVPGAAPGRRCERRV